MNALEQAYSVLLYAFTSVCEFVFNESAFYDGSFTYGQLIMTASLAWIVIKAITGKFLDRERIRESDTNSSKYERDTDY